MFDKNSNRKISYWYGARSQEDLIYDDYLEEQVKKMSNFRYHVGYSELKQAPNDKSYTGYIHQVVLAQYLKDKKDLSKTEFYLCGPPPMIQATLKMLDNVGVSSDKIFYDEF